MNSFLKFLQSAPLEEPHSCNYLPERIQQNQEFWMDEISDADFELLLSQGFRHFGDQFFRYACSNCGRCLPIRVPVKQFVQSKHQRRLFKKTQEVRYEIAPPIFTPEKAETYRKHKQFQFQQAGGSDIDYLLSFVLTALKQTQEFTYFYRNIPVAYGYVDILPSCLSSLYFFYDPEYRDLSLGTFSILCELQYALEHGQDYLYLGYYIAENHSMSYKAEFRPCEVFSPFGTWTPFRDEHGNYLISREESRCHIPLSKKKTQR
ncbi:MAG: arginyltransferase [Planctomycetota bacterium]